MIILIISIIGGFAISYFNTVYSPLLSTSSLEKMKDLNDKYGFELGEDLLSQKKSNTLASLLRNDVLDMEGGSKNKGIIVKFNDQSESGQLILMTPNKKIPEDELINIAIEYSNSIPEINFAEADIELDVYSDSMPEIFEMNLMSKLLQSAFQNASKYYTSEDLFEKAAVSDKWWIKKRVTNHSLRARLNFSNIAGRATIAVLDSGADITHPYFSKFIWNNTDEKAGNKTDDDHNGYIDDLHGCDFTRTKCENLDDGIGHGTHMIGIISKYTTIESPGEIAVLKVFDKKSESRLSYAIKAIKYAADNNMRVLNISFGTTIESQALKDATEYAYSKGSFIVAAAGNNASSKPHYPAAYDKVISVGALNNKGERLEESNYGDWVDLSALGERVLSTIPNGRYGYLNGTSQAAPFVSAEVSNILLEDPNIGIEAMKEELKQIDFMKMSGPSPYDVQ